MLIFQTRVSQNVYINSIIGAIFIVVSYFVFTSFSTSLSEIKDDIELNLLEQQEDAQELLQLYVDEKSKSSIENSTLLLYHFSGDTLIYWNNNQFDINFKDLENDFIEYKNYKLLKIVQFL